MGDAVHSLTLKVLGGPFAVHRLPPGGDIPAAVWQSAFFSVTQTDDELSVVCPADVPLNAEKSVGGWAALKIVGPLDFALTGILAGVSTCLAEAGVPIFAVSTFDTDYILVQSDKLAPACDALQAAGHRLAA